MAEYRKQCPQNTIGQLHIGTRSRCHSRHKPQESSGPTNVTMERGSGHEATPPDKELFVAPGRGRVSSLKGSHHLPLRVTCPIYCKYKFDLMGGEKGHRGEQGMGNRRNEEKVNMIKTHCTKFSKNY